MQCDQILLGCVLDVTLIEMKGKKWLKAAQVLLFQSKRIILMNAESNFVDGGCTCRFVRYRMTAKPPFVHCCQRESGAAFALNAMIESDWVELREGEVEVIDTPAVPEYYNAAEMWPKESLDRRAALMTKR